MKQTFLGKKVLVLTAHPDDEQIAAGTMYANYKAGGRTILVCATLGEKGKSHLTKPVTDAALKKIRKSELMEAAGILKINEVKFLGLPDARLKENKKAVFEKMLAVAQKVKPDQILSFGPDGISAHWDHITVGEAARKIAKKMNVPLAAFTFHPLVAKHRGKMLLSRRKFGSYADLQAFRKGDIVVKIDARIKRKARAAHRSQFTGSWITSLPSAVLSRYFAAEHFVNEVV